MYLKKKIIPLLLGGFLLSIAIGCITDTPGQSKQPKNTYVFNRANTENALDRTEAFTSNLPIVIIDTSGQWIRDEPKIPARMKIIHDKSGGRNALDSSHIDFEGKIGIEIRGKLRKGLGKNSTALKLRTNKVMTKMFRCCNCQRNRIGF